MKRLFLLPGVTKPYEMPPTKRPRSILRQAFGRRTWQALDESTKQELAERIKTRSRSACEGATLSALTARSPGLNGTSIVDFVRTEEMTPAEWQHVFNLLGPPRPTRPR